MPSSLASKEEKAAYLRKWVAANPEKVKANRDRHRAAINARRRLHYATDPVLRDRLRAQAKAWQRANPEKRKAQRLVQYNLTLDEFREWMERQDNRCAICDHSTTDKPNFFPLVDHDHRTGAVRGLLCMNCNQGLGKFQDDPMLLVRALDYLSGLSGVASTMSRRP